MEQIAMVKVKGIMNNLKLKNKVQHFMLHKLIKFRSYHVVQKVVNT